MTLARTATLVSLLCVLALAGCAPSHTGPFAPNSALAR